MSATGNSIIEQFSTAYHNPAPIAVITVAVAGGVYWLFERFYSARFENQKSTIERLDGEVKSYKEKFEGASPDAAKAQFMELEDKVRGLSPRTVSPSQSAMMAQVLRRVGGHRIIILSISTVPDSSSFADDLASAFESAGWTSSRPVSMGQRTTSSSGLNLEVHDPARLTTSQQGIAEALDAGGIRFDLVPLAPSTMLVSPPAPMGTPPGPAGNPMAQQPALAPAEAQIVVAVRPRS